MTKIYENNLENKPNRFLMMKPNYGWVPFPYFQQTLLVSIVLLIVFHKPINAWLDKHFYDKIFPKKDNGKSKTEVFVRSVIALIPIFIMIYFDMSYSSFSMNNLGVLKYIDSDAINVLLKLFGAYAVIQVAAEDFGLKTGKVQSQFAQLVPIQYLIYAGAAFVITGNRSAALIAAIAYYMMKYFASNNETKTYLVKNTNIVDDIVRQHKDDSSI